MLIKSRSMKRSDRGIYIQDKELKETDFKVGTKFSYFIDMRNKVITLTVSDNGKNHVSNRNDNPVLDIRNTTVLSQFKGFDNYILEIYDSKIILKAITITNEIINGIESEVASVESSVSIDNLSVAVGTAFTQSSSLEVKIKENNKIALEVASLFSGAGMLDRGLLDYGFKFVYAIDNDPGACETYRHNIGTHIVCNDILREKLNLNAPVVIAGVPCVKLSNSNRVDNLSFTDNSEYALLNKAIKGIKDNKNCKLFAIENVPQLITCNNGYYFDKIKEQLSDFEITYTFINAMNFGTAQIRERAIIIGSKIGLIPLYQQTGLPLKTVRQAFNGLNDSIPNQLDYTHSNEFTIEKMNYIPPGGNIFDIPDEIRPNGQHSNSYRRLRWDEQSITIVNPRKAMILHPEEDRILSVRECARLQGLPDSFVFKGTLSSKQQQVANGVPFLVSKYVGFVLRKIIDRFNARFDFTNKTAIPNTI